MGNDLFITDYCFNVEGYVCSHDLCRGLVELLSNEWFGLRIFALLLAMIPFPSKEWK